MYPPADPDLGLNFGAGTVNAPACEGDYKEHGGTNTHKGLTVRLYVMLERLWRILILTFNMSIYTAGLREANEKERWAGRSPSHRLGMGAAAL